MRLHSIAAALLLLATRPAVAQVPVSGAINSNAATAAGTLADGVGAVQPGDLIRLSIWREPDLSGDFPVDETGVVVFPKIGPVTVVAESPGSLKAALISSYQRFLSHSSIRVTLLRRVQVLGAVRNPGLFSADATMTVADVLALAGGTTPQGNPDKLVLLRRGERVSARLSSRTIIGDSPIRSGDELYVPERGWISRNQGIAAAGVSAVAGLLLTVLVAGR